MNSGIFTIPGSDYLADTGNDVPTLNSTVARLLLTECPRKGWWAHPRLNPDYRSEERDAYDFGSAFHAYYLEGVDAFEVVDAPDWRTKAAQAAKANARLSGRIPLLLRQFQNLQRMSADVTSQLKEHRPRPFTDGTPEATLVWEEDGAWCRARLDYLRSDFRIFWDLKTTNASCEPDAWGRYMFSAGLDMQLAFYSRGVKAICGVEPEAEFIVAEIADPHLVSRVALAPDALALAHRKVARAIDLWRECLATGDWPAYSHRTCFVEAPPWELAKAEAYGEFNEKSIQLADQA